MAGIELSAMPSNKATAALRPSSLGSLPKPRTTTTTTWILSSLAVLFVLGTTLTEFHVVDRPGASSGAGGISGITSKPPTRTTTKHVFCYGDSLTAGISPPRREKFPYGKYLEDALRQQPYDPTADEGGHEQQQLPAATVQWLGRPGWTAPALLARVDVGVVLLQAADDRSASSAGGSVTAATAATGTTTPPFDLVIVLAGTNDLGHATEPGSIIEAIKGIHAVAHELGCPTVALGIPPSGFQSRSEKARTLARSVNEALESWASSSSESMVTYVPYPIRDFDDPSGDELWSPDGLHFSPEGYEFVAESLSPVVAELLWKERT